MSDLLKGILGKLLIWLFSLGGIITILLGIIFVAGGNDLIGIITFIIGAIFFAIASGIKYYLGRITRIR